MSWSFLELLSHTPCSIWHKTKRSLPSKTTLNPIAHHHSYSQVIVTGVIHFSLFCVRCFCNWSLYPSLPFYCLSSPTIWVVFLKLTQYMLFFCSKPAFCLTQCQSCQVLKVGLVFPLYGVCSSPPPNTCSFSLILLAPDTLVALLHLETCLPLLSWGHTFPR